MERNNIPIVRESVEGEGGCVFCGSRSPEEAAAVANSLGRRDRDLA